MSEDRLDVAVVGNVGIDTCVFLYGRDVDWSVEANFTQNIDYVGQAGGFTSRGYAQLGKRTAFIGTVGDDWGGRLVREAFAADGVDTTGLWVDAAGTSRSVNIMYSDGRRKNFYDGKTALDYRPDLAVCHQVLSRARLAHVHLPNWARFLLPMAKELGLTVACDLQDVVTPDDPYRQDFIEHADILFFSAANWDDPRPLIARFRQGRPDRVVVCGMGARGCAVGSAEGIQVFPPPPLDLPIVDTNGAGDALAVGFLTSYVLDGYSLGDAVLRGQIAARWTCAQKASSSDLIRPPMLDAYFQSLRQNLQNEQNYS